MTQDWAAVARAVNARLTELGITQNEAARRAEVSRSTFREILLNSESRTRRPRILEDISTGLEWNSGYLAAILDGRTPPDLEAPPARSADDLTGRLDAIEYGLNKVVERLDRIISIDERLDRLERHMEEIIRNSLKNLRRPMP